MKTVNIDGEIFISSERIKEFQINFQESFDL